MNRIGEDAGRYYFDEGAPPGRWCGAGRHHLGVDGVVTRRHLDAVLGGQHPDDGVALSSRQTPHRRAGWDLIFTAPKSLSLLAAFGADAGSDVVAAAHRRACADAFVWLETHGCWARRDGGLVATSGFVAARFAHQVSAAEEPHLHTHVLVANVTCAGDGRWSAVDGSGLWCNRRAVAAVYHLALRQQLLSAGLRTDWVVQPDGTADLEGVPRGAIEATSSRRRHIQRRLLGDDDAGPVTRTAVQRLSRQDPVATGTWRDRSTAAGFGVAEAGRLVDEARRRAAADPPPPDERDAAGDRLARDVTRWLAQRRSTFGVVDVMQALSATHAEGAPAAEADRWARDFVAASPLAVDGRRTSALARAGDQALLATARTRRSGDPPAPRPPPVEDLGNHPSEVAAGVRHLTSGTHAVAVLAPPGAATPTDGWTVTRAKGGFVAQAAVLDAARVVWQRRGQTVAVATTSERSARRWQALAGLDRHVPGGPAPAVLIVDRADRRTTGELAGILERSARHATMVVLVEGGTLPARRAPISQGLAWIGHEQGRIMAATGPPGPEGVTPEGLDQAVTHGRLTAHPLGRQALHQVVATWTQLSGAGSPARMVGLGPAECDELNRRAREHLRRAGALGAEEVVIGGRPFAVGDEVVATRRGALPAGALGRVRAVTGPASMTVECSDAPVEIGSWNGRHLRHAYAMTPGMLHFDDRPVVALADPADLGRHRPRLAAAALVTATVPRPSVAIDPAVADRVDGLVRISACDPASAELGRFPADPAGRHEWRRSAHRVLSDRILTDRILADRLPPDRLTSGSTVAPELGRSDTGLGL